LYPTGELIRVSSGVYKNVGTSLANKGKDSYSDSALLSVIVVIRYIAALNTPNQ
jgi:hypothetical protein